MPARPPIIDQLTIADPDNREECGEACDAMLSQALGKAVSAKQVVDDLRAQFGSISAGTDLDENEWFFDIDGLSRQACNTIGQICGALAAGQYVMILIRDDATASPNPAGPYEHYIVIYADNGATFQCINPWGGRDEPYGKAVIGSALIAGVAVWNSAQGVDMGTDPQAVARDVAYKYLGREHGEIDQALLDQFARAVNADGTNIFSVIDNVVVNPEATEYLPLVSKKGQLALRARIAAIEAKVAAVPSTPAPLNAPPAVPDTAAVQLVIRQELAAMVPPLINDAVTRAVAGMRKVALDAAQLAEDIANEAVPVTTGGKTA